jgi:aminoglycoside/choline kinase family phosphotransferase
MSSDARGAERYAFLNACDWGKATITPLPGDASTRHYFRLSLGAGHAMLMDQPQGAEAPTAATDTTESARRALGYNAVARLAGADCARFVAVGTYLRDLGLSAPAILAADTKMGFVLLEDLGDALFANALSDGSNEAALYKSAAAVLAVLHARPAPQMLAPHMPLFAYDETAMIAEVDLLTEWFLPLALGRDATAGETGTHRALWRAALHESVTLPPVFVHRDYHAQNLLWLPERVGVARVGLIDFQDAVAGSPAYDLISLIEDARRDVGAGIGAMTTAHYLDCRRAQAAALDETAFRREMAIMAAQRNAKIAGIFARLFRRDGKARYLALLPRVWGHLARDLTHPALADLRAWYDRVIPPDKRAIRAPPS